MSATSLAERFKEAVDASGLEQAEIERRVSGKAGGHLNHVLAGRRTKLAYSIVAKYADVFGVSETWLASGDGSKVRGADAADSARRPSADDRWQDFADRQPEFLRLATKVRGRAEMDGRSLRAIEAALNDASDRWRNYDGEPITEAEAKLAFEQAWAWLNDEPIPAAKVAVRVLGQTPALPSAEDEGAKADDFTARLKATKKPKR